MSAITLPRIVEAMENGLASLDHLIAGYGRQIDEINTKRDKAMLEAKLQRDALNALIALDAELGKGQETLTLRFPQ